MAGIPVQESALLNRFFRMALVAGVENAVRVHIDRGDNLNARDEKGRTPLMLSAARNQAAICKLLLAAGADAGLLDPLGRDALGIAQAAGALEAVSAIEAASMQQPSPSNNDGASETFPPPTETTESPEAKWAVSGDVEVFNLSGWEAEEESAPPEGDPSLAMAAVQIQAAITNHQPIDPSADWADIEAFLPDRATPLPRTDNIEVRERLRLVLLRAIREGSVPYSAIEDLARGEDGEPDEEAGSLLGMVINDLGAETDERFEYSAPHESFEVFVIPNEKPDEEGVVADAFAFVDDWVSRRNEPLRIYQQEFQRVALLTAEAEVALSQAMERNIEKALDVLATWPAGVNAVLAAASKVADGMRPLRWMSFGLRSNSGETEAALCTELVAEPGLTAESSEAESDPKFSLGIKENADERAEFCAKAEFLSGLAIGADEGSREWNACRDALASLDLTRDFLLDLADSDLSGEHDPALVFRQAMSGYRCARDQMAVSNLKLAFSIAKKHLYSGQPLDDLLQEGTIGLLKAVDRYDWRKGFKFSTYASWWIRQQIGRFIADKGKTIRLPVHLYQTVQQITQATHAFELRHARSPTVKEIATIVKQPLHKVEALSRIGVEPLPLHGLDDIDCRVAPDAQDQFTVRDPMDTVEEMQLISAVDKILGTLTSQASDVLRMRFGIGIQESMTLDEVGTHFGVTRERIRQIEAAALRKLKHPARLALLIHEHNNVPFHQPEVNSDSLRDDSNIDAHVDTGLVLHPSNTTRHVVQPKAKGQYYRLIVEQARAAGVAVEESIDDDVPRILVRIVDHSDRRHHKLIRKMIELGFEFWPGKGYRR
jgi:RNA polymerase primary sigma factor